MLIQLWRSRHAHLYRFPNIIFCEISESSFFNLKGPYRHYVLNAIWIFINSLSIMLTMYHLHKLYKDSTISSLDNLRINRLYSSNGCPADSQDIIVISPSKGLKVEHQMMMLEEEGINQVKMFVIITLAYLIFWGPLFIVTLANISIDWKEVKSSVSHEVGNILPTIILILIFILSPGVSACFICPCNNQPPAIPTPTQGPQTQLYRHYLLPILQFLR